MNWCHHFFSIAIVPLLVCNCARRPDLNKNLFFLHLRLQISHLALLFNIHYKHTMIDRWQEKSTKFPHTGTNNEYCEHVVYTAHTNNKYCEHVVCEHCTQILNTVCSAHKY